ncbi:Group II intron-encoded protein LtrA [Salinivirga cyanobacteriivorans]|uniref:RNA-directed DNA polymerase n=1 Tax=Salinivirga cyanobacteriivorans TaxID=1307839 RepID=A0A0S2I4B0_9BACT|nr:group II intron reverse transcriptase/maturase [Salinivirga cyanobacteriivorans]ALO17222.1 Group II intron-encoded protein LtrA [Salinivirga cyanobacteriivorans]ALO17256.1 Group II intron-encoded protein LtrA [Salinivirga cyanobacteriivorans]
MEIKEELIDKILQPANLTMACKEVVRNKGAGGVDGMKVSELEAHLHEHRTTLTEQIRKGNYHAQPIRGKEIPKGGGKMRLLGIPTAVDRTLQQAVLRVVMLRYEQEFSNYSYGFRPERNTHQAVGKSLRYINSGYQHIVEIDLKQFFDNVDHVLLLQLLYRKVKCKATMSLIRRWLRAPLEKDGKLIKRRKGVPQGSPISPLLSNIILHELDTEMERLGLRFVRYADDFSIYCKTKSEARRAGNQVYLYLRDKLKLPINREKSGIRRPTQFQILGFGFAPVYQKGVKGKYQLVVTRKRWKAFKAKLKDITRKTKPMNFDERIAKLKEIQRGWLNAFKYANIKVKLEELDGWLRNRLRYCIWHHWKKPEKKRRSLLRLGVDPDHAYAWSRTRMGGWAVAQSPILGTTITKTRLKKRGYVSLTEMFKTISKTSGIYTLFSFAELVLRPRFPWFREPPYT